MFSAHEYLITCPHRALRVGGGGGGGSKKHKDFYKSYCPVHNAAPRITKNCITGKTLGGTFDHYIGLM